MESVVTSIRMPKNVIEKLRSMSKENDRSLNYVINELIKVGLKDRE